MKCQYWDRGVRVIYWRKVGQRTVNTAAVDALRAVQTAKALQFRAGLRGSDLVVVGAVLSGGIRF